MLRTRYVRASPTRSASATWETIRDLVCETVSSSSACFEPDARAAMHAAAPAGRMLIAGGHLDRHPVVLVAGAVHCEIRTVSGAAALDHEENLNPIPGAATATAFTIYLPSPEPLGDIVSAVAAGHARLSDEAPPADAPQRASSERPALVDLEALRETVNRQ